MRLVLRRSPLLLLALWVATLVHNTAFSAATVPPVAQGEPATPPPSMTPSASDWLIVPELPANATQADYGAEIYRLVCQACHGEERLGLTPEWIASWPPAQQNCWQSKCHAPNHPPDGFGLPRYVPPLSGTTALRRFATALDLYEYIRSSMPWQNPGSLTDEQYWQLTAFLVREKGIAPIASDLNHERASVIRLHPDAVPTAQPDAVPTHSAGTTFWWATVAAGAAIVALTSVLLYGRHRTGRQNDLS